MPESKKGEIRGRKRQLRRKYNHRGDYETLDEDYSIKTENDMKRVLKETLLDNSNDKEYIAPGILIEMCYLKILNLLWIQKRVLVKLWK